MWAACCRGCFVVNNVAVAWEFMFWCFKVLFNRGKHTASVSAAHEMAEFLCSQLIEINQLPYYLPTYSKCGLRAVGAFFSQNNVAVAWEFMFWCFRVLFNRRKHTASVSAAHEMAEFLCNQFIEINQLPYYLPTYSKCGLRAVGAAL